MPLPSSGPISLNDVNVELGLAGTTTISMNSNIVRVLFEVPTNASSISMSNGYGKANVLTLNVPSQNNLNLRTLAVANGGSAYTKFVFNINGNIGSTSSTIASLVTDTTWAAGSEILINIGAGVYVAGAGGGSTVQGGTAISLGHNVTIVNNGVIAGGGGGGGSVTMYNTTPVRNGFGGTGAGLVNGSLYAATNGTRYDFYIYDDPLNIIGGNGGALGSAGSASGGNYFGGPFGAPAPTRVAAGGAGLAIKRNGYTATTSGSGTTLGAVVA